MPSILNYATGAVFVAGLALPAGGTAQAPAPRGTAVAALNTVMDFRSGWMEDSTRFDGCSVYRALGSPADFPSGILEPVRPLLDRTSDPCAADPTRVLERRPLTYVRVDSISTSGDSAARVHLSVRKGDERTYFETYELTALAPERPLGAVREVRIWGVAREYLVRPRSAQSSR